MYLKDYLDLQSWKKECTNLQDYVERLDVTTEVKDYECCLN